MRTRHSPRNQETLWRELGRRGAEPLVVVVDEVAHLERVLARDDPFMSPRTRRQIEADLARARVRRARAWVRANRAIAVNARAPELDAAELRRCLARDGLPAGSSFHGRDPYVGVVEADGAAVGGRFFPARNAILVHRHRDPEVTRATVVHELAHHRSYQEECGGTEVSNRTRCRYRGEHDAEFYARLEPMYREAGVPVYAAREVEGDYDYPARWRGIERW